MPDDAYLPAAELDGSGSCASYELSLHHHICCGIIYCLVYRKLGDFERNDEVYDAIEDNEKAIEGYLKAESRSGAGFPCCSTYMMCGLAGPWSTPSENRLLGLLISCICSP